MDTMSKLELLCKCKEFGITKCSSKNKSQLMELINLKIKMQVETQEQKESQEQPNEIQEQKESQEQTGTETHMNNKNTLNVTYFVVAVVCQKD